MKNTQYNDEFKESMVRLYESGKPTGDLLNEYGIPSSTFYKWVQKFKTVQVSETESMSMAEVRAMQKKLALLEEENNILKKTISIFSRE